MTTALGNVKRNFITSHHVEPICLKLRLNQSPNIGNIIFTIFFSGGTYAPGELYGYSRIQRSQQPQTTQPLLQAAVCSAGGDAVRHGKQEVCNTDAMFTLYRIAFRADTKSYPV